MRLLQNSQKTQKKGKKGKTFAIKKNITGLKREETFLLIELKTSIRVSFNFFFLY